MAKKSIFVPEKSLKTTKNPVFFSPNIAILVVLNFFLVQKIDFLPFLKLQIMFFCTFAIALFSNFRALCYTKKSEFNEAIHTACLDDEQRTFFVVLSKNTLYAWLGRLHFFPKLLGCLLWVGIGLKRS